MNEIMQELQKNKQETESLKQMIHSLSQEIKKQRKDHPSSAPASPLIHSPLSPTHQSTSYHNNQHPLSPPQFVLSDPQLEYLQFSTVDDERIAEMFKSLNPTE